MLNPRNPLAQNLFDNNIGNTEVHGMDPEGQSPFENNDNNVVTPELNLNRTIVIIQQLVSKRYDLLAASTQMGIYIFIMVKEYIYKFLSRE